jgi:hypothetical protein
MEDSEGGPQMGLRIKPLWDPTGAVSVVVDEERRELVLAARGERLRFVLREDRPERLGWVEHRLADGRVQRRRVAVGEVVCHCLREWDAEQQVIELSEQAVARALERGGRWEAAGRRLADQTRAAPRRRRVSTLPFQVLFEHRSNAARETPITAALAAERIGYRMADGRSDTQRLLRRFGLADHRDGRGGRNRWQRSVRYETGVALCRAVEIDPVELGL